MRMLAAHPGEKGAGAGFEITAWGRTVVTIPTMLSLALMAVELSPFPSVRVERSDITRSERRLQERVDTRAGLFPPKTFSSEVRGPEMDCRRAAKVSETWAQEKGNGQEERREYTEDMGINPYPYIVQMYTPFRLLSVIFIDLFHINLYNAS